VVADPDGAEKVMRVFPQAFEQIADPPSLRIQQRRFGLADERQSAFGG
jgi:hypothetical protein